MTAILSTRYVIEPHSNGLWRVECETWFIDRHGAKEWRQDTCGTFASREAADAYIRRIDRPLP